MKKISTLLLSLCAVGTLSCAVACNQPTPTPAEPIKYSFQVYAGQKVKLGDTNAKVVVYDKNGTVVASLGLDDSGLRNKTLNPDIYTVCLESEDGEKIYTTTTQTTCDSPVALYYLGQPTEGTGDDQDQYQIEGNDYFGVPLSKHQPTFFAFTPDKVGTYRITSIGNADVAYKEYTASDEYLNPVAHTSVDDNGLDMNFAYEFDITPTEFNSLGGNEKYKIYFSVGFSDKATDTTASDSIILIEYLSGDYQEEEAPVYTTQTVTLTKAEDVLYNASGEVVPFTAQAGTLTPVAYNANLVYNENDRYYHLNSANGPVVVMPFTVVPERLLDQPFNKIGNPDPNNPNDNANPATLHLTFKDDVNHVITVKEYNTLINDIYPSAVNADGVYPLTEEMREFLYQFVVVAENDINVQNVPKELRWKAPLYYYETGTVEDDRPDVSDWDKETPSFGAGTKASPYRIGLGEFLAPFGSVSGIVYYTYTSNANGYLTISTEDEKSVIAFINETITTSGDITSSTSESGDIYGKGSYSFEVSKGSQLTIQVCTNDWETAKVPFKLEYSTEKPVDTTLGSAGNPYDLQLGETLAKSNGKTVLWYAITPTETAEYLFSTLNDDATISVFEGMAWGTTVKKTKAENGFTVTLEAGKTYYIGVDEGANEYFTVLFTCTKA